MQLLNTIEEQVCREVDKLSRCQLFYAYVTCDVGNWNSLVGLELKHKDFGVCEILEVIPEQNIFWVYSPVRNGKVRLDLSYFQFPDIYLDVNFPEEKVDQVRRLLFISRVNEKWIEFKSILQYSILNLINKDRGLIFLSPQLDEKDKRLVWLWHDHFRKRNLEYYLNHPIPDYYPNDLDWPRLMSARLAEKAAKIKFDCQIETAEDISIQQLDPCNDGIWRKGDIRFKGQLYDVKNARRSHWNEKSYVEHSIPRFKTDPVRAENDVQILGVLSDDLKLVDYLKVNNGTSTAVRILGITDASRLSMLEDWFSIQGQLIFNFQRDKGDGVIAYLPPWVYRMPDALYTEVDQKIQCLHEFINCSIDQVARDAAKFAMTLVGPFYLSCKTALESGNILSSLPCWVMEWLDDLRLAVVQKGYRYELAFVFASILKHFITMAMKPKEQTIEYTPAGYRKYLYQPQDEACRYPLLVFDPLNTVNSLIDALDTIWRVKRDALQGFNFFRLQNALIFRGYRDKNDRGTTLIAYCGGEKPDRTSCHYYPLVIGQEGIGEPCTCGHLICPECGYCSQGCSEWDKRKTREKASVGGNGA